MNQGAECQHYNRSSMFEFLMAGTSLEHRLRLLSYSRFSANFWQDFLLKPRARSSCRPAGGTARGSERRDGPAASMSRRRDAIPSRWRECRSRNLACRCKPRGDGLPFDSGRAFKRHRQSGWALGVRGDEWAFAPLAAARGTSALPTGGSCACLRRRADREQMVRRVNSRYFQSMGSGYAGLGLRAGIMES